jgi:hypothetical protein
MGPLAHPNLCANGPWLPVPFPPFTFYVSASPAPAPHRRTAGLPSPETRPAAQRAIRAHYGQFIAALALSSTFTVWGDVVGAAFFSIRHLLYFISGFDALREMLLED